MRLAARLALHSTIAAVTSSIRNSRHTLLVIRKCCWLAAIIFMACLQRSARMSRPVYPRENLPNAFLMRQRCKRATTLPSPAASVSGETLTLNARILIHMGRYHCNTAYTALSTPDGVEMTKAERLTPILHTFFVRIKHG